MNSFVMLSKNIRSWELFHDHLCVNMYIHLLTLAAWRERKIDPFCLHPGEVLTSQSLLQEELLIGRQEVRKTLEKLEKSGAVKIVLSNNYGTIIKVNNFKDSEVFSDYTGTRWQPATNQQKTSLKVDTTYNIESKNNKYKKYNKNNIINNNINNYNIPQTKEEESDRETGKPFKENGCRYGTHI